MDKQSILNMLSKHSLSERLIYEIFSDTPETRNAVKELIDEGKIVKLKKEFYTPENLHLVKAKIVSIKSTYSFAAVEGEDDIHISNDCLNSAFIDDEVYLILNKRTYEYEVFSIIKRARKQVVGELKNYYGTWLLDVRGIASDDTVFYINATPLKLFEGNIVLCKITKQNASVAYVDVVKILGNKNEPGVDVSRIIYKYNADIEFPQEVRDEVNLMPTELKEEDYVGYEDFTDRLIVTIDGEDAKDFDDAVEVTRVEDGYEVGVHIADVTHYVKYGSALDKEALSRGTSIYVADRVVPMLPFELSNGICSLNPHVDRCVQSCLFKIDLDGNIVQSRITHGVMNSKARLTYTYVNKLLGHQEIEKHFPEEVDNMLFMLDEVARKLRRKRTQRGALEVDSTEIKFVIGKDGNPIDVIKRTQGEGEKLIEDLMIAANEIVAETIERKRLPFIYRIHEQPKAQKIESFMKMSNHLGYKANFSQLSVTPKELQNHMAKVDDSKMKSVLSMMLLRSLAKARYLEENKGHYGLASVSYTHFTSPIRRYPDLLVHRLIDRYIIDGNVDYDFNLENEIAFIAENSSVKERRAMSIEREVDDLEAAKLMATKVGNKYKGFINGMTNNGMFVELENGIDGYIEFLSLQDDYYIFDERYMRAVGKRTNHKYNLGDEVEVIVSRVSLDNYQITFDLINSRKSTKIDTRRKDRKGEFRNGKRKGRHK